MAKKTDRSTEAEIIELNNELQELAERHSALQRRYDTLQAETLRMAADHARIIALKDRDFDNLRNSML